MYGWSITCCLPDGLAHAGLGRHRHGDAAGHPAPVRRDAGFAAVDVLPMQDDFFRFYRLH